MILEVQFLISNKSDFIELTNLASDKANDLLGKPTYEQVVHPCCDVRAMMNI